MNLRAAYQKLVTKVTDLENEKADMQSELDQLSILTQFTKTDFVREREELQAEITELQMLVEDLRLQVHYTCNGNLKRILLQIRAFVVLKGCM